MHACFFSQILEQAGQWQAHIPPDGAFADMVLRPITANVALPQGRGLMQAEWCARVRAYNCRVDAEYLMHNIRNMAQHTESQLHICDNELRFLALRLALIAEQTHPMPDAGKLTLRMFHVLWAMHSPATEAGASAIHGFLRDLRAFTEENLYLRASCSPHYDEKRPIQRGESCAIVAENGLLMLRLLCTSLTIPARFLEA